MGNRTSISFRKGKEESIVFFDHWGGADFPKMALKYAKNK
jgi:hypothetical protein